MKRIILPVIIVLGLAIALVSGVYGKRQFERFVVTTEVVVPRVSIPAHTIVSRELLTRREVPRSLVQEPICQREEEVVGQVALGLLPAGAVIYRDQLAPVEEFRLTEDPALEVVSFPVPPERAVGGQIQRGMRINIYRIAVERPEGDSAARLLELEGAAVELLCEAVPVVDVRSGEGGPAGRVMTRESSGGFIGGGSTAAEKVIPPKILTVAVPPEAAREIVRLQGETKAGYELWVTLSPLERVPTSTPTRTPLSETRGQGDTETRRQGDKETRGQGDREAGRLVSPSPSLLVPDVTPSPRHPVSDVTVSPEVTDTPTPTPTYMATPTETPTPTPTPTCTPTPTAEPAVFVEVLVDRANLREGPGTGYEWVGQVARHTRLRITGRNAAGDWWRVCCYRGQQAWIAGWLVEAHGPLTEIGVVEMPASPIPSPAPTPTPTMEPAPFELAFGPTGYQTSNLFLNIWVKVYEGGEPGVPLPGFQLRVLRNGMDASDGKLSGDVFHTTGYLQGDLLYNLKYEYGPDAGEADWLIWLADQKGRPVSRQVAFTTRGAASRYRVIYIGFRHSP